MTGPIDFSNISSNVTIELDVSVYCDTSVYCPTCVSDDRSATSCQGSSGCGATCSCGCPTASPTSFPTVDIFECLNDNGTATLLMNQTLDVYDIFEDVNNLPGWWENSCNICEWDINGTNIVCDENQTQIIEINLSNFGLSGSLSLSTLPQTIKQIDLSNNNLIGSLDWIAFESASSLEMLYLNNNNFNGTIDLQYFGSSFQVLNLSVNDFSGT